MRKLTVKSITGKTFKRPLRSTTQFMTTPESLIGKPITGLFFCYILTIPSGAVETNNFRENERMFLNKQKRCFSSSTEMV